MDESQREAIQRLLRRVDEVRGLESLPAEVEVRAGEETAPARTRPDPGSSAASLMEPQAWHCGHCPSHLPTVTPHSLHRCDGRSL